jgi:hypothetical protein
VPEVVFVMSSRQDYGLRELAATLQYELELQGIPCRLHLGRFPETPREPVHVLLDPAGYTRLEGEQALPEEAILRRTVFLCAEPPPSSSDDAYIGLLQRAGAVFALDQRSVVALHRLGIAARLLRPGYSKSLDHFDPEASRPIDVLFLGTRSTRRTTYLQQAASVLSGRECVFESPETEPSTQDADALLAAGRWALLTQAKVLISLHRDEGSRFEWRQALDAIHAGAVVVTEHSSGIAPLVPAEHLFVASADSLPYVVDAVLRDERRLARVRSAAYERLSAWIPYGLWVSVLRAAIVELVGEPVPGR